MAHQVTLRSQDGQDFKVDVEVARMSCIVKDMLELEDCVNEDGSDKWPPVLAVRGKILAKVITWAEFHRNDPSPSPDEAKENDDALPRPTDDISDWDLEFLKVDNPTLFDIIIAANYLDIKGLLDTACKSLAKLFKNKTVEEIRQTFNISTNDFTPAEEEKIIRENEWCAEK